MIVPAAPQTCFYKSSCLFLVLFCVITALGFLFPRSLSFLPSLLGVCAFFILFAAQKNWPAIDKQLLGYFCAAGILALLSCLWSVNPDFTLERSWKMIALLGSGFVLLMAVRNLDYSRATLNKIILFLCFCVLAHGLFFWHEYATAFQWTRIALGIQNDADLPVSIVNEFLYNRSLVYMALISWPLFYAVRFSDLSIRWKWTACAALAIGLTAGLFEAQSQTAQIIIVMMLLMSVYPSHKKLARRGLLAVIVALMLVAPWIPPLAYEAFFAQDISQNYRDHSFLYLASIPQRLEVWKFMALEIQQRPWLGHGIEATRFLYSQDILPLMRTHSVLHPHNAVLQIWIELGALGIALMIGFVCHVFAEIEKLMPQAQKFFVALFVTLLGMMSMGYGIWQGWQLGMIFLLISFSLMIVKTYEKTGSPSEKAGD